MPVAAPEPMIVRSVVPPARLTSMKLVAVVPGPARQVSTQRRTHDAAATSVPSVASSARSVPVDDEPSRTTCTPTPSAYAASSAFFSAGSASRELATRTVAPGSASITARAIRSSTALFCSAVPCGALNSGPCSNRSTGV